MAETVSYKCPSCGGTLKYSVGENLFCEYCGKLISVDYFKKKEEKEQKSVQQNFEWGNYKQEFEETKERMDDTVVYVCNSCGAEVETTATTAATHCPYCDSEVIMSERVKGGLKPNGIIPFKFGSKGLREKVDDYIKGKKLFLPNNFLTTKKLSEVQGLYVPFWLFDSEVKGTVTYRGEGVSHSSDSRNYYTETRIYKIEVSGKASFRNVPVDASKRMGDDLMDSLEPFDFGEIREFSPAYMTGFLADRFDDDPDKSLPRAQKRMVNTAAAEFINGINHKYSSIGMANSNLNVNNPSVKYVMLPVYLINASYKGKDYRFAVNGQTGKMIGEIPQSKAKIRLFSCGIGILVAGIVFLLLFMLFT